MFLFLCFYLAYEEFSRRHFSLHYVPDFVLCNYLICKYCVIFKAISTCSFIVFQTHFPSPAHISVQLACILFQVSQSFLKLGTVGIVVVLKMCNSIFHTAESIFKRFVSSSGFCGDAYKREGMHKKWSLFTC